MNYYFPYNFGYPYSAMPLKQSAGLFSRLFKNGINWGGILNGTQKTLGFINQTIPTIKQISPVIKNAKTMFKVMNEFKKVDTPVSTTSTNTSSSVISKDNIEEPEVQNNDGPIFFA